MAYQGAHRSNKSLRNAPLCVARWFAGDRTCGCQTANSAALTEQLFMSLSRSRRRCNRLFGAVAGTFWVSHAGERHHKAGAPAGFGLNVDGSPMVAHDPLADPKSETGTASLIGVKWIEELDDRLWSNPGA